MTVQGSDSPGLLVCTWFDEYSRYGKKLFFDYMLVQVKRKKKKR